MSSAQDSFTLFDLRIDTVRIEKPFVCSHQEGESFMVIGENLVFDESSRFSLYALASLLPLLPAKQRHTESNDWMNTDDLVACPDPNCGARFRIVRTGTRIFHHSETTITPLPRKSS